MNENDGWFAIGEHLDKKARAQLPLHKSLAFYMVSRFHSPFDEMQHDLQRAP